jgi:hypothetical protein
LIDTEQAAAGYVGTLEAKADALAFMENRAKLEMVISIFMTWFKELPGQRKPTKGIDNVLILQENIYEKSSPQFPRYYYPGPMS